MVWSGLDIFLIIIITVSMIIGALVSLIMVFREINGRDK